MLGRGKWTGEVEGSGQFPLKHQRFLSRASCDSKQS
jgi:hypothetical protein